METQLFPPQEKRRTSPDEVLAEIEAIKAQIAASGAHDNSEMEELQRLIVAVANGRMTPDQGIARARGLQERRQEYH